MRIKKIAFQAFYSLGLLLLAPIYIVMRRLRHKQPNFISQRGPRIRISKFPWVTGPYRVWLRNSLGLFFLATLVVVGALVLLGATTRQVLDLKGRILGLADQGLASLNEAESLLKNQQIDSAQQQFAAARQYFESGQRALQDSGLLITGLTQALPPTERVDRLLVAAQKISQAGAVSSQLYQILHGLKFNAQGLATSDNTVIPTAVNLLHSARDLIGQASNAVAGLDPKLLPPDKQAQFLKARDLLSQAKTGLDTAADLADLLQSFLQGQHHILLVFQNNNELRPTGGFIGTFGALDITDGRIANLRISSVYDLDGQLKENIEPPRAIRSVSTRWFLRDSNWWTDFPESAQKIKTFYEKEAGQSPDAIIALDPSLITALLTVTGPIDLPQYKVQLTADNFVQTTQFLTSVAYDKQQNKPKQMLADFFPIFLGKLGSLTAQQFSQTLDALQRSLEQKHLLIWSSQPAAEQLAEKFNWAGKILDTDRDYLLVASGNFGGTKTDLYLKKHYALTSQLTRQGITESLTITVENPLADLGSETLNRSFLRVYVPKGSTLDSLSGNTRLSLASAALADNKTDRQAQVWESQAQWDYDAGTVVGEESGKTVFGFWLETPAGQTKTVKLQYHVPLTLRGLDHYSLLLQKQPGSVNEQWDYQFSAPGRNIIWKSFSADGTTGGSAGGFKLSPQNLGHDEFLGLVLN